MATRDYLKHFVSNTAPTSAALGDEWYNPATNLFYKNVAVNGTTPTFNPISSALTIQSGGTILNANTSNINFVGFTMSANSSGVITVNSPTAAAAGVDTSVQYNNSSALAGSSSFTWNNSTQTLAITGFLTTFTLSRNGNLNAPTWTTTSPIFNSSAALITDTTGVGTIAIKVGHSMQSPNFASTSTTTITDAVNLYVNANVASTNTTITNNWSLYVAGNQRVTGTLVADALTTVSTVTHNAGTANGVAFLNGSKVLTTGSALTFDGSNLGIGTSSPAYRLSVANSSAGVLANFTDGVAQTLRLTTGSGFAAVDNPSGGALAFQIASTERMRLDTSGNVGIGTSSPGYRLDVQAATAIAQVKSTTGTNAAYYVASNTGGDFYIGRENSTGAIFSTTAYSSVFWSAGAYPQVFFTNGIERLRITETGGIAFGGAVNYGLSGQVLQSNGNTAPTWINQSSIAAGSAPLTNTYVGYGSASNLLTGSSNFTWDGIKLLVSGTSISPFIKVSGTGGLYSYIQLDDVSSNGYLIKNILNGVSNGALAGSLYTYTDNGRAFQHIHAGTALFTILSTGNLGIGTATPGYKVNVVGANPDIVSQHNGSNASRAYITSDNTASYIGTTYSNTGIPLIFMQGGVGAAGTERMRLDSSGNLGIGTTSPAAKLHILGVAQNTLAIDSPVYPEITYRVSGAIKVYNAIVTTAGGYFSNSVVDDWIFRNDGIGSIKFGRGGTTDVTINSSGNLIISTGFIVQSIAIALAAAGTTQGTALSLTKNINDITTAVTGSGVALPLGVAGIRIMIRNSSNNSINVYPYGGSQINSGGVNAAFALGTGTFLEFVAFSTTQWYTTNATFSA